MTLDHALILFDAMDQEHKEHIRRAWIDRSAGISLRDAFVLEVESAVEEIERGMLLTQPTEGRG